MQAVTMVVGPRPGLVIVKFWQGVVEIVLRVILIVCCLATFIASAIALHHTTVNLPPRVSRTIDRRIEPIVGLNYGTLRFNSLAAAGTGVGISLLFIIYELIPILLRFLNIGLINLKIKIFLSIDVIISFVLASVLALVGILSAYVAVQWARLEGNDTEIGADVLSRALNVLAATAGTSLLASLFGSFLSTWIIFFLIQKWNEKVIKETIKSAL